MLHTDRPSTASMAQHDEDEPESVVELLIDAAAGDRRILMNALYVTAHFGGSVDRLESLIRTSTYAGVTASAAVAESLVTLLLSADSSRTQRQAYLDLAEQLTLRQLCDAEHFEGVLVLLALDRGCETGCLPADIHANVERYIASRQPDWREFIDGIEPEPTR